MSDSTQIGYRLRIQPSDLSTYPDRAKRVWFDLVVKYGLIAKDKDLAKGLGADGKPMRALRPKTIKYRKSEVGPVTKTAPPLIPALELSRVRSLLTGRAHSGSAEFWWKFDSVSGDSFAVILRYQRDEYGRDVFGLSPRGTAWTLARATKDWEAWKASPEAGRLTAGRPGIPAARQVRKPIPEVAVRQNLDKSELFPGARPIIEKAIAEGRFPGFRRLNARGEQWKPGTGIPPPPAAPRRPPPPPVPLVIQPPKLEHTYIVIGQPDKPRHLEFDKMIQGLSEGIKSTLKRADIRHVIATKLIDYYPELEKVHPKGWPAGMTWENSDGLAQWGSKRVVIATHRKNQAGEYVPTYRFKATFYHETGHGLDLAMGRPVPLEGFEFTAQKPWQEAWEEDVNKLTPSQKLKFAYYLQTRPNGPQETFAELFANFHGESLTPGEMLQDFFPKCKALLTKTLESLK